MIGFRRRRPERAALRRHRAVAGPETLEVRQLLAANSINPYLIPREILAPTFPPHPAPVIT